MVVCPGVCVPAVGAIGNKFTPIAIVLAVLLPQALLPVTLSVPEVAVAEKFALIEFVPLPDPIVNPVPE